MDIKKWNALSKDILPLINQITDVLDKHDYERIYSVSITAYGYISVYHNDKEETYRFYRFGKDDSEKISVNLEEIKEESDEN